jgi:hypothetical protein
MDIFIGIADKIFEDARINKTAHMHDYNATVTALHEKMAQLSVMHGLSKQRVNEFDAFKRELFNALKRKFHDRGQLNGDE